MLSLVIDPRLAGRRLKVQLCIVLQLALVAGAKRGAERHGSGAPVSSLSDRTSLASESRASWASKLVVASKVGVVPLLRRFHQAKGFEGVLLQRKSRSFWRPASMFEAWLSSSPPSSFSEQVVLQPLQHFLLEGGFGRCGTVELWVQWLDVKACVAKHGIAVFIVFILQLVSVSIGAVLGAALL